MSIFSSLRFVANHPLNRGRKARALLGFLKWQIGSRLVPGRVIYDWVNGSKIIVRSGEAGVTGNVYCGLHEFADMAYVLHVLRSEDLFVDIGANVGSYTVLACAAKGARGYCFEPVPSTFARLLDNIRINNLTDRVAALNVGLSDREGELAFTSGENCTNHVIAADETSAGTVRVKVLPLDTILAGETPAVIKIDVEGFETPVLGGARAVLGNEILHSVIMELNGSGLRYGFDENRIIASMRDFGFSAYSYEPFSRELTNLAGNGRLPGNVLFVRHEQAVRSRLQQAPQVRVGTVWL